MMYQVGIDDLSAVCTITTKTIYGRSELLMYTAAKQRRGRPFGAWRSCRSYVPEDLKPEIRRPTENLRKKNVALKGLEPKSPKKRYN